MERLRLRVSSLLKGFVLALIFSVFLQASLASADGATELDQTNFYSTITADIVGTGGVSTGGNYVLTGGINILVADNGEAPSGATVFGTFTGTLDGNEFTISGLTKPLFGELSGDISNLNLTSAEGVTGNGALTNVQHGTSTIYNVSFTGDVTGNNNVGGLVGSSEGAIASSSATGEVDGIENVGGLVGNSSGQIVASYAASDVIGIDDVSTPYLDGGSQVGGLVGSTSVSSTIENSYATGAVEGRTSIGGLVGYSNGTIASSSATGAVDETVTGAGSNFGGLVGSSVGTIDNSYATGEVDGTDAVGGLAGISNGAISNSYATGEVYGVYEVGGLVGFSNNTITDSYATGAVNETEAINAYYFGGLVGYSDGAISNSYATGNVGGTYDVGGLAGSSNGAISNSYATGNVDGTDGVGGLVGISNGAISNSYATGDVTGNDNVGGLVGVSEGDAETSGSFGYGEANIDGTPIVDYPYLGVGEAPNILTIVNTSLWDGFVPAFGDNASINSGRPFLISLLDSYDVVEEDTEETPSFSLRSYYTQAAKRPDKALTSFGFKSNFSSHPNLGFKALEQNQSKLPAVIQLFEVSEYQNSNILLSKDDGFQLSISSYYKEGVEIWTQGLDGEYLYLGLVEFDKDGQAILPTLKFDTASTHQLLMIKAADKLSEKPNLEAKLGQITINVF